MTFKLYKLSWPFCPALLQDIAWKEILQTSRSFKLTNKHTVFLVHYPIQLSAIAIFTKSFVYFLFYREKKKSWTA